MTGIRSKPRQMSLSTKPGFTDTALKAGEPCRRWRWAAKRILQRRFKGLGIRV